MIVDQVDQQAHDVEANQKFVQQGDSDDADIGKRSLFERVATLAKQLFRPFLEPVSLVWTVIRVLGIMLFCLGLDPLLRLYCLAWLIYILSETIFKILVNLIGLKKIYDLKEDHLYAKEILELMSERFKELSHHELVQNGTVEANYLAIKNHIPEIVVEFTNKNKNMLLQCFDQKDPEKNMFALAVIHRQEKMASFLYKLDIKNATSIVDEDGNNLLHLAAKLAPHAQLAHKSGAALQLQSELHWFKLQGSRRHCTVVPKG